MGLGILSLVTEFAERRGEFMAVTPDAAGSETRLISGMLADFFVEDVARLNAWLYCPETNVGWPLNAGLSRRVTSYTHAGTYLTCSRAWPSVLSNLNGPPTYYLTTRTRWDRLRAAINAGIADLAIPFAAPVTEQITIVDQQYTYTLPSLSTSLVPTLIEELAVSITTSSQYIGYPYATATPYNWRIYTATDPTTGTTTYTLQFEILPPTNSIVRIYGRAPMRSTGLTGDSDFVACDPQYDDIVQEYLLMHASYMMAKWDLDTEPVGKALYALQVSTAALQEARAKVLERLPRGPNARIVVPGRGDGRMLQHPDGRDSDFLAAHSTLH